MRREKDLLGLLEVESSRYWGIHTERAIRNFPLLESSPEQRMIIAYAMVKKACALANQRLKYLDDSIANAIITACDEIIGGELFEYFPLSLLQGGAGTSMNMNINEVIANRALEISGKQLGEYALISPIDHVNLHQSTNDTFPTALKVAVIYAYRRLSAKLELLQGEFNKKDIEFAKILTIGRTEMMPAVPMTLGSFFAAWAEAFARDRWRTFKCEERLRVVNIGGTAVGTGLTAPRNYIFDVIDRLREITGLGLMRSEQLTDATANADVFSEVSGILNSLSANLLKISSDLRLLHAWNEIELPAVQAGSSIMPGKVNPVILEFVMTLAIKSQANDMIVNSCVSRGSLQINEFLPLIAHSLLESLELLAIAVQSLADHVAGIRANEQICRERFDTNETIITAFVPHIGYYECERIIGEFKLSQENNLRKYLHETIGFELTEQVLSPENLTSLGYRKKILTSKGDS